ncbi:MAG: hypothetical protein GC155_17730 [Alphaproteobacteria bacterium]|nr:hypothetical protein [Alphaproteobacteria bacterium]
MGSNWGFRLCAAAGVSAIVAVLLSAGAAGPQVPPPTAPAAAVAADAVPDPATQPPILAPGEFLVPLKSGCAIVLGGDDTAWAKAKPEDIEKIRSSYASWIWNGPCRFGVAHGSGWFSTAAPGPGQSANDTFVYGHQLGRSARYTRMQLGGQIVTDTLFTYIDGRRNLTLSNLRMLDRPSWGDLESSVSFSDGQNIVSVQAFYSTCGAFRNVFRGCASNDENAKVYGLGLATDVVPPPGKASKASTYKDRRFPCPNYYDPSTCVSAWQAMLAPYSATIEDIIKATDARDAAITEKASAPYAEMEARIAADQARKAAEAKATADRIAAEKAAAEKAAADAKAAAEKAEAEAAAAEKARQDAEYAASLKPMNAGELFVKATEMKSAGQPEKAQTALKSLLTRYPDSPLAAQAAQQLSTFGGAPASAPRAATPTSSPAPRPAAPATPQWTLDSSMQAMSTACASQIADLRSLAQTSISPITHRNGWAGEDNFQKNQQIKMSQIYGETAQNLDAMVARDEAYFSSHPLQLTGNVEADGIQKGLRADGAVLNCMRRQRSMQIRGQIQPPAGSGAPQLTTGSPEGNVPAAGCSMTQNEALQTFDSEFRQLTNRYPLQQGIGSRATYQYAYFIGVEGVKLIEPLKACMGVNYSPNRQLLQGAIDNGKKGCEALAVDPSACVPQYPTQ